MSKIEEIEKWHKKAGYPYSTSIDSLIREVKRLRSAIEEAYKCCNDKRTIPILREALNGKEDEKKC